MSHKMFLSVIIAILSVGTLVVYNHRTDGSIFGPHEDPVVVAPKPLQELPVTPVAPVLPPQVIPPTPAVPTVPQTPPPQTNPGCGPNGCRPFFHK